MYLDCTRSATLTPIPTTILVHPPTTIMISVTKLSFTNYNTSACVTWHVLARHALWCQWHLEIHKSHLHFKIFKWCYFVTNTCCFVLTQYNIFEQCAFVCSCGAREYKLGDAATSADSVWIHTKLWHPHVYIHGAHMNKPAHCLIMLWVEWNNKIPL